MADNNPLCDNTRCLSPPRFRLVPYGQRKHQAHTCNRHLARTAIGLLATHGGPLMTYSVGQLGG